MNKKSCFSVKQITNGLTDGQFQRRCHDTQTPGGELKPCGASQGAMQSTKRGVKPQYSSPVLISFKQHDARGPPDKN